MKTQRCPLINEITPSKIVPTLWRSFAFLATVDLPFLFEFGDVLSHGVRALRDAVIVLILESGGVRGENGLKSRPAEVTDKSALLVSHPGCGGDPWEVEKEDSEAF